MDATQLNTLVGAQARRLRTAGATAVVVAVLLSGCGSSDDDASAPPALPSSATTAAERPAETSAAESQTAESETAESETAESETAATSAEEEPAAAAVITIAEFTFEVPDTIGPGTEVTVINEDSVGHTVTSEEEGLFDVAVGGGEEVTFTVPEEAGDYPFYCRPHPNMTSVLVVG